MSTIKNKLFNQISSFSPKEWKLLNKFILNNSKSKDIKLLLNILNKKYPNSNLSKETIFNLIYPNKDFNDHTYRNLIYKFNLLVKKFLANNLSDTDELKHLLTIKKLKKHLQFNAYNKEINKIKNFHQSPTESYFIAYEEMEILDTNKNRQVNRNLQAISDNLDIHYINEKLKIVCTALNDVNINNTNYSLGLLESLENEIEKHILDHTSQTYLLYQCYIFLYKNKEDSFLQIIETLKKNTHKFSYNEELKMILSFCVNFCIGKINKGQEEFFAYLFEVYNFQLLFKTIYDSNGFISSVSMRNILTVSLRIKDYNWSENFIESNKDKIHLKNRDENYYYLKAKLNYTIKKYNLSLRLLAQIEPEDFLNNLGYRVLQIKCWQELEEIDLLENGIENFRLFLLRHKGKTYHYSFHINFIKYMKQITKSSSNKELKKTLLNKLQNETQVAEKSWLMSILK